MVDIYLKYHEGPKAPFFSIPDSDIKRLSNLPFRWLHYIIFSICGARGDLLKTSDNFKTSLRAHTIS